MAGRVTRNWRRLRTSSYFRPRSGEVPVVARRSPPMRCCCRTPLAGRDRPCRRLRRSPRTCHCRIRSSRLRRPRVQHTPRHRRGWRGSSRSRCGTSGHPSSESCRRGPAGTRSIARRTRSRRSSDECRFHRRRRHTPGERRRKRTPVEAGCSRSGSARQWSRWTQVPPRSWCQKRLVHRSTRRR